MFIVIIDSADDVPPRYYIVQTCAVHFWHVDRVDVARFNTRTKTMTMKSELEKPKQPTMHPPIDYTANVVRAYGTRKDNDPTKVKDLTSLIAFI